MSSDGRFILSAGERDGTLRLWDIVSGRCLRTLGGQGTSVLSVCLSADSHFALSGHAGGKVMLWDLATEKCLRTFDGAKDDVTSVCLSIDGRLALSSHGNANMFVAGTANYSVKIWEVATGKCLSALEGYASPLRKAVVSDDNRFVVSRAGDKQLRLWNLDWELEEKSPADWDEGARSYLETYLAALVPYGPALRPDRIPSEEEITSALTRQGKPVWTSEDFQRLRHTLGCAGFGWLRPEAVQRELQKIANAKYTSASVPSIRLAAKPSVASAASPPPTPLTSTPAKDFAIRVINEGVSLLSRGHQGEAVELHEQAIRELELQAATNASDEITRYLALLFNNKSSILLRSLKDARGAVIAAQQGISILEPLVHQQQKNEYEDDLARAYMDKANAHGALGDYRAALELQERGLVIFQRTFEQAGTMQTVEALAKSYMNKALTLNALKQGASAAACVEKAVALFERLVGEGGRRDLRPEVGKCKAKRAGMLFMSGDFPSALQDAREAVTILSEEIKSNPGDDLLTALRLARTIAARGAMKTI